MPSGSFDAGAVEGIAELAVALRYQSPTRNLFARVNLVFNIGVAPSLLIAFDADADADADAGA
jgi:hypothetical protein